MANVSISTGNFIFSKSSQAKPKPTSSGGPMHIALIGDFSGRGSRAAIETNPIAERKSIEVDRDNFEDVFARLKVELKLNVSDHNVRFEYYDDLHPDFLCENLSLFSDLRVLKRKLSKPQHFAQAAEEIQQWATFTSEQPKPAPSSESVVSDSLSDGDMLEAILTQSQQASFYDQSPEGSLKGLIKDIVSPFVEAKADPRQKEMEAAVDQAIAQTMRRILHSSSYQNLEAAWRSVDMLTRRTEASSKLKFFLVDISREEILADLLSAESLENTQLYKRFVEQSQVAGATPFGLLNVDLIVEDKKEDVLVASAFAQIAEYLGAKAVLGASPVLAGCTDISRDEDAAVWTHQLPEDFANFWDALRQHSSATHLALAAPRYLVRLPYGKKTSPIESFEFEELGEKLAHEYYLWGNSAYLVTLAAAQAFSLYGWDYATQIPQKITELPLHIYYDEDDDAQVKACAEIFMRDSAAGKLAEKGILVVRSIKNEAAVVIPSFCSISSESASLFA